MLEAFMDKFGSNGGVAGTPEGAVISLSDEWAENQQPGALDKFIDKFNGVTEPYFFYDGTVELRFQTDEHIYYRVGELGQLTPQDGVTTICHIIDKSTALVPWSAKMVVAKLLRTMPTVERPGDAIGEMKKYIADMSFEAFEKIALEAKSAPRDVLEEAGNVGHMAHTWLEFYIKSHIALGEAMERGDDTATLEHKQAIESKLANRPADPRAAKCVEAALDWMRGHNVRWISTERKIYSKRYSYAGTMDGLCTVDACNDPTCCMEQFKDRLTISDWKTSNYLYVEYLYQTAAYEAAYEEEFGVDVKDRWILRLGKEDGEFEGWHCTQEDFQEDFEAFLDALSLTRSVHLTEERMKGQKKVIREAKKIAKALAKEAAKEAAKVAKAAAVAERRAKKAEEKEQTKVAKAAERAAFRAAKKDGKAEIVEVVAESAITTVTGRFVTTKPSFIELDRNGNDKDGQHHTASEIPEAVLVMDFAAIEQRVIASLPTEQVAAYGFQLPVEKVGV